MNKAWLRPRGDQVRISFSPLGGSSASLDHGDIIVRKCGRRYDIIAEEEPYTTHSVVWRAAAGLTTLQVRMRTIIRAVTALIEDPISFYEPLLHLSEFAPLYFVELDPESHEVVGAFQNSGSRGCGQTDYQCVATLPWESTLATDLEAALRESKLRVENGDTPLFRGKTSMFTSTSIDAIRAQAAVKYVITNGSGHLI